MARSNFHQLWDAAQGIPMLLKWDYSFFAGNAQLIQYCLYSLTAVMSFIIFGLLIGLLYNYFSKL